MRDRGDDEGHFVEFADWCKENGIQIEHESEYRIWWECWNAALDAREAAVELVRRRDIY